MGVFQLRLDDSTRARWDAAAKSAGADSLAGFIRDCVEGAIEGEARKPKPINTLPPAPVKPKPKKPSMVKGRRLGMCVHGNGSDVFCKRCDGG